MAKNTAPVRTRSTARNWIAYLCEALVTSGVMPTWEAATYLTENLFGEKPNPRLLEPTIADSGQASVQAPHWEQASFVVSGTAAAMMPTSLIWGWEQAFGQSARVTRNS